MLLALALVLTPWQTTAFAVGQIIPDVRCEADSSQGYAIYLPSTYTPERTWPIILAFDPGGRGRTPVERYQAAAERYGYIVAGSNNSRNGAANLDHIVATLTADLFSRVRVDPKRMYAAGMSGGARVAFLVALGSGAVAGVIASSAGYPDGTPRKKLPFPVFATAGTEDFNHLEMRLLDRDLTTPHRLTTFEGGHVWLSSDLAVEAVGWMELQAMKSGLAPREDAKLDRLFAERIAAAQAAKDDKAAYVAWQAIAVDFESLKDVGPASTRAAALGRSKAVQDALKKDRVEDDRELHMLQDFKTLELRLASDERQTALMDLRKRWKELAESARKPDDSSERRLARRVLGSLSAGATTTDPDYLKIIAQYRIGRGRG